MATNQWEYDYSNLYQGAREGGAPQSEQEAREVQRAASGSPYENPPRQTVYQQPALQPQKQKGKTGKRIAAAAVAVVLCAGVGLGGGYAGGLLAQKNGGTTVVYQAVQDSAASADSSAAQGSALSVSELAETVKPSVVEVTTEQVTTNAFFGQYVTSGAGSGVIISEDGYIVTNNHVVSGASQIKVKVNDAKEYTATLVGRDSESDIAVLKIDATGLTPAVIGSSAALSVGNYVVAVGNPLGQLGGTVTDGIISALDREVKIDDQTMNLMQTNAAVSPGNSGGGLFNAQGQLIGIVNAKSSNTEAEGLGFAIPIDDAMKVAQELMANGYVTGRPALGVTVLGITDAQTAAQYNVSTPGVYIVSVEEGGAAAKAGLQVRDMLVSVDGNAISTTADVVAYIQDKQVGDTVEIQVARDKQVITAKVTLGERTAETASDSAQTEQPSAQQGSLPFAG